MAPHSSCTVRRVLTDNGSCYKSQHWAAALAAAGIVHKRTRPYRPQTNGKVERFNRTLLDEWAYIRPYTTNQERADALGAFLHTYNHHRSHTALDGKPPISRDLAGQYRWTVFKRRRQGAARHGRRPPKRW